MTLERDVARRRQSSLPGSLPDFGKPEMDLQQLRHLNQDLLQRLKANQEEFRKCLPFVMPSPSATPERKRMLSSGNRIQPPFGPDLEGATLNVSETRNSQLRLDSLRSERRKEGCSPSWGPPRSPCMVVVPSLEAGSGNGETAKEDAPQKPPTASCPELKERTGAREELTQNPAEEERRQGTSARMPQTPKSILLTPGGKHGRARKKKEAGHVTFVSDTEEPLISADSMSAQPFLGYDWIAGLLETDTSLSEKPEEYFAELQNFRQVNKEACIRDHGFELEDVNSSALDQEMETEAASHQCVFCYRLNKRLFTVPMDPESACPVCKTPRAEKPPETLVEPAFVRCSDVTGVCFAESASRGLPSSPRINTKSIDGKATRWRTIWPCPPTALLVGRTPSEFPAPSSAAWIYIRPWILGVHIRRCQHPLEQLAALGVHVRASQAGPHTAFCGLGCQRLARPEDLGVLAGETLLLGGLPPLRVGRLSGRYGSIRFPHSVSGPLFPQAPRSQDPSSAPPGFPILRQPPRHGRQRRGVGRLWGPRSKTRLHRPASRLPLLAFLQGGWTGNTHDPLPFAAGQARL
ncbi:migration and invasion-inhibitory protein isoform X2 [Ahaetulla prasina]|uniref:migration and invasion-inhibitory protein isoform X2 n=1 Tax=Ahaetulla prasina TaxID=499056 RepID=UPI0026497A13|nr:migration and invasion-inhibitory protein isoform X2 [Ahaetulla prasina]